MNTDDLEPVFIALHRYSAARYNHQIRPGDFRRALQELDGAFLSYNRGHASYLNPSVRDFVASVIMSGLRRYENRGANGERYDCRTLDELTNLRDSFNKLHSKYGLDLKL